MNANILKKIQLLCFFGFVCLLIGCTDGCKSNKLKVNVADIDASPEFMRFDQELFQCKNEDDLLKLYQKYQTFCTDFTYKIMCFVPVKSDSLCFVKMLELVRNEDIRGLFDSTQRVFSDDLVVRKGITDAMKHYKYYFKNDTIPKFISFISVLTFPNTVGDDYIGIGLDMYLGKNFPYYYDTRLNLPQYFINYLSKEYLLRKTIKSFIEQRFETEVSPVFIERAVQQGKVYYMLDDLCPEMHDSIKLEYSGTKLQWMQAVEQEMWVDLVNRKVLYSKNRTENDKFFTDGPFTNAPDVSQDSPPRVGEWLGWQIVKKYMENHPKITLEVLMNETDLQKIFKESGYRPK